MVVVTGDGVERDIERAGGGRRRPGEPRPHRGNARCSGRFGVFLRGISSSAKENRGISATHANRDLESERAREQEKGAPGVVDVLEGLLEAAGAVVPVDARAVEVVAEQHDVVDRVRRRELAHLRAVPLLLDIVAAAGDPVRRAIHLHE